MQAHTNWLPIHSICIKRFGLTMAGVAVGITISSPLGLPCSPSNSEMCSTGIKIWNNNNDFGFLCGPSGTIVDYQACSCKNCCHVNPGKSDCP
ncbi:hypothetical protein P692DRAFT_20597692 [Suillus brevipes Sb2]|nr:hypothetical protein P692DRAFT_20597692 [Suillus brevipes Sb2]